METKPNRRNLTEFSGLSKYGKGFTAEGENHITRRRGENSSSDKNLYKIAGNSMLVAQKARRKAGDYFHHEGHEGREGKLFGAGFTGLKWQGITIFSEHRGVIM